MQFRQLGQQGVTILTQLVLHRKVRGADDRSRTCTRFLSLGPKPSMASVSSHPRIRRRAPGGIRTHKNVTPFEDAAYAC